MVAMLEIQIHGVLYPPLEVISRPVGPRLANRMEVESG